MSTLYELTNEYRVVLDMLQDGETDEQVLLDTLEGIDGEIEIKADNYAKIIKELEGNALSVKTEIDRLGNKKATLENNAKKLKDALEKAMREVKKDKFKTTLFSFNIQKNPPKLVIDLEVPDEFLVPQPPKVDNSKIKDLLKTKELEFAHLEQGTSLRIR